MSEKIDDEPSDEVFPSEFRRPVVDGNKFQLPSRLVREVGFRAPRWDPESPKVAWYYYEKDERAVLANDTIDIRSLEMIGACALSGVDNGESESYDGDSPRVTIIKKLPDALYERLTTDRLVLKPLYATHHSDLNGTCVSVYPAGEYDRGTLPNVTHDQVPASDNEASTDSTSDVVGKRDIHQNYHKS